MPVEPLFSLPIYQEGDCLACMLPLPSQTQALKQLCGLVLLQCLKTGLCVRAGLCGAAAVAGVDLRALI